MKICMLSTMHSPLDDRIYYKEVLSLARKFPSIFLVMPEGGFKFKIEEKGIEFVPMTQVNSLFSRFLVIVQAVINILKIRPQVYHFHDYELIFIMPLISLLSNCKIVYDVHEVYPEMALESKKIPSVFRPFFAKLVDFFERKLSYFADYIITTDDNISNRFRSYRHVSTIFNYPRLSIFVPDKNKVFKLKERYKNRIPIIYNGGMDENKGLFQMINAMQIVKNNKPDVLLLLVGPMSQKLQERVNSEIKEKDIKDNVEIVGWVPHKEVVNYICISKIGLIVNLPTKKWFKNIPIKQFEYMACGIPVLGANLPPIASYINEANCGKVFDSTSIEELASGIVDILQDESEWRLMSEAGKKAVNEKWNWDRMETRLFRVYEELLNNS